MRHLYTASWNLMSLTSLSSVVPLFTYFLHHHQLLHPQRNQLNFSGKLFFSRSGKAFHYSHWTKRQHRLLCSRINIYNGIIFPSLNPAKFFRFISHNHCQKVVQQFRWITCAVINTSKKVKCPLLWEFWILNFSLIILERVLVGNIVNIRNEWLFFLVHGERGSHNLFVPHEPRK